MGEKRALADAMSAVSSVAFRGKSGTMARIDPEATIVSDEIPALGDRDAEGAQLESMNPSTGTVPIMKSAPSADAVTLSAPMDASSSVPSTTLRTHEDARAPMPSMTVDVGHEVALAEEAAVPDVFGPRARAMSLPDGRGEIRMTVEAAPKLRPLTYSVLANSERPPSKDASKEATVGSSRLTLAAIFMTVLVFTAAASYWLTHR